VAGKIQGGNDELEGRDARNNHELHGEA